MSIFEELKGDTAELINEIGRPVVFRGRSWKAIVGDAMQVQNLEAGGFVTAGAITVKFRSSDFSTSAAPTDGEKLTYAGTTYRITAVSKRIPASWYDLTCDPINA